MNRQTPKPKIFLSQLTFTKVRLFQPDFVYTANSAKPDISRKLFSASQICKKKSG